MNYFDSQLQDLDDSTIFLHGVFGTTHVQCCPWSTIALENACKNSKAYGSVVPYVPNELYQLKDLKNMKKKTSGPLNCNICSKTIDTDDYVMLLPVLIKSMSKKQRIETGTAICNCKSILNGHLSNCDFS